MRILNEEERKELAYNRVRLKKVGRFYDAFEREYYNILVELEKLGL